MMSRDARDVSAAMATPAQQMVFPDDEFNRTYGDLLKETLSVWQVRVPYRMSPRNGVSYLHAVGRLADAGVVA